MMAAVFKCCKSKECTSVCCVQCFSIFHSSCIARRKSVTHLDGHTVICSTECEKERSDEKKNTEELSRTLTRLADEVRDKCQMIVRMERGEEERVISLNAQIDQLTAMNEEKDAYIRTLKRRTTDFEDEVFDTEQKYISEVKIYKARITDLNREIVDSLNRNDSLRIECDGLKAELERLRVEISECNKLRESMLTSIETLTEENHAYVNEFKQLKCENFNLKNGKNARKKLSLMPVMTWESGQLDAPGIGQGLHAGAMPGGEVEQVIEVNPGDGEVREGNAVQREVGVAVREDMGVAAVVPGQQHGDSGRKRRVLILCDDSGRYVCDRLTRISKTSLFSVETIIKPNARLEDVIENMDKLTKKFSKRDHVIIMAGKNNFSSKQYPKFRFISDRLRSCSANVVFVSTPVYTNSGDLCKYIAKFNSKLNGFLQKVDHCVPNNLAYIEANGMDGLKVKDSVIFDKILREVTVQNRVSKNLVFINTVDTPEDLGSSDSRKENEFFRQ